MTSAPKVCPEPDASIRTPRRDQPRSKFRASRLAAAAQIFVGGAWVLSATPDAVAQGTPGNVLIIIADDLGVDQVGCYDAGGTPPPTPNIDGLAANGVKFRNAWSNPLCSPTRAGLYTGRYSFRTGVGDVITDSSDAVLPLDETTLPEALDLNPQLGYQHALFGKWHLGTQRIGQQLAPETAGFGAFAGTLSVIAFPASYERWPLTSAGQTTISHDYATTKTAELAADWIAQQTNRWVLTVAFNAPHQPFHAPPDELHTQNLPSGGPLAPYLSPTDYYRAMVEAMDTEIGNLLGEIANLGQLQQTTVLFLGDNGTPNQVVEPPFSPTHAKGTPFQGGIHVPLIASGYGVVQPGREDTHLVHTTDVFATVLDLAGATLPSTVTLDSVSMASYLQSPITSPKRTTVFSEWFNTNGATWRAIRDGQYKLIRFETATPIDLLFDLDADPQETNNLIPDQLTPVAAAHYVFLQAELQSILDS